MKRPYASALVGTALAGLLVIAPVAVGASAQPLSVGAKSVSSIDKSKPMSATDKTAIDAAAADFLAQSPDQAPGLWLAVWDPAKGYYEQAYGKAILPDTPATVTDHFMIGSITKTVLATAVLQQVAAGQLALSDTVAKLDPALAKKFPKAAKYTVAQLLSMTTQIPDYADEAVAIQVADPQHHFTRNQLIALGFAKGKPLPKEGGYSTTNYLILGTILEKLTGTAPERLVNGVFRQAGMTQSRLPFVSRPLPAPAAHGYLGVFAASQFAPTNPDLTASTDISSWTFDWGKEGGGAWSTIGDLATWGGTCLGNSLLPKPMVAKRLVFSTINVGSYGRGIIRKGDWLSHGGQAIGYQANVACNPKTGAVVASAVNSTYGNFFLNDTVGPVAYPEYYAAVSAG
jgi:D-alanyl-D-alanine carboxypeptidase